ncbi:unnamed protein product [Moneuplotes crassus]|uniref:Uncharacterized protein n=1 Tax=Euplotes crassus TaxID=5936 RepID=A0AAD1XUL3_EUPCR|nr:unnamed protein product [Moneuplotes crassus]
MEEGKKDQIEVLYDKTIKNQDHLFKLIIIGDSGVGKSCLLSRIMDNTFKEEHNVTIGVEFGCFIVKVNKSVIKLQIWDTAGQESFQSITRIFYRGANCVFLTYDIQREESFLNIKKWLKEAKVQSDPDTLFYLIGNQADCEDTRAITKQRAEEYKVKMKLDGFYETSAKNGQNVESAFIDSARKLYKMTTGEDDSDMMPSLSGTSTDTQHGPSKAKPEKKEFTRLKVAKHASGSDISGKKKKRCC